MKKLKKAGIILLIISIVMSFVNVTPIVIADTYENYVADKVVKGLKPGEEVYFNNSATNWTNVYIYIWDKQNGDYKAWANADAMTKIGETDIYKFVVPDEQVFEDNTFSNIIFKNGISGDNNQTIDLGFIESGFCYIANSSTTAGGRVKKLGYWYLYDKASIVEHLNSSKQYQQNKAKYTEESYGNLDDLITQAATELENEIRLYAYKDDQGNDRNLYYITIATTLKAIDAIIDNLEVYKGSINIRNR